MILFDQYMFYSGILLCLCAFFFFLFFCIFLTRRNLFFYNFFFYQMKTVESDVEVGCVRKYCL